MISKIKTIALAFVLLALTSCNMENSPNDYFDQTTLNTNLTNDFISNMYRNNLKYPLKDKIIAEGSETRAPKTYVEYIQKSQISQIEGAIAKIKALKPTAETSEMIELSLDYFNTSLKMYQTDLMKLGEMLDNKAPETEVLQYISDIEAKDLPILIQKREALYAVGIPYAKKNGIEVRIYNSMSFS